MGVPRAPVNAVGLNRPTRGIESAIAPAAGWPAVDHDERHFFTIGIGDFQVCDRVAVVEDHDPVTYLEDLFQLVSLCDRIRCQKMGFDPSDSWGSYDLIRQRSVDSNSLGLASVVIAKPMIKRRTALSSPIAAKWPF